MLGTEALKAVGLKALTERGQQQQRFMRVQMSEPEVMPESESIVVFANSATYSLACLQFMLTMWCASHHRPFKIVDDAEFQGMLGMLYNKVHIPLHVTVSWDVQLILDKTMACLIDRLEVS